MDRYALFGNPVAGSPSPAIHAAFARQTGAALTYQKQAVPTEGFGAMLTAFFDAGGKGLNVTLPFKREAFDLAERSTPRARRARAVNTLWRDAAGALVGDNTDGAGFIRDLTANHSVTLAGRRVLLLGAGGAARGVLAPLLDGRPACLHVANRTGARARALAGEYPHANVGGGDLDTPPGAFDLIVNATSAGHGGAAPRLPADILAPAGVCYDLSYGAAAAPFLAWARDRGAALALDGWGMLVEQAAESFYLWRGVRPETASLIAARQRFLPGC